MRASTTYILAIVLTLLSGALPLGAQQKDLTYHAVPPFYIVNTLVAGGQFAPNETRIYNVVGNGSFAGQGGSTTGCGIPGFSNGVARVQAVAINVVVVNPTGAGHIWALSADAAISPTATPSFLNFPAPVGTCCISLANTGPVAVAQTPGVGDLKMNVAVSGAHVVASVVGYYTRFGETLFVGPGDTNAASGAALLAALTSIADSSSQKPYLIKLEPGIYDIGTTMLLMKPWVNIEGSGQNTTTIQGVGNNDGSLETGVILGASNTELRNLRVRSLGAGWSSSIGMVIKDADTRVKDVKIVSRDASVNWGIRVISVATTGLNPSVERCVIEVQGGTIAYGIVNRFEFANTTVRDSTISVSGAGTAYGFFTVNGFPGELTRLKIDVSGTSTAAGIYVDAQSFPGTFRLGDSTVSVVGGAGSNYGALVASGNAEFVRTTLRASGGASSYGISDLSAFSLAINHCEVSGETYAVFASSARIGATRLDGGAAGGVTCAGVYDENYSFFASSCP